MKQAQIIFLALCISVASYAQNDYSPLLKDGKKWSYDLWRGLESFSFHLFLDGDTTIADKRCLKLYKQYEKHESVASYLGALYEEGRQVYFCETGRSEFWLHYDFGINKGDTFYLGEMAVLKNSMMDFCGKERHVIYMKSNDNSYAAVWIEGIGCIAGLHTPVIIMGNEAELKSCIEDGMEIFKSEDYTKVMNFVKSGISNINVDDGRLSSISFDLYGRRITARPQRGLYIRDGRKYVVKE
jgi:hypothetical protein